MVIGQTRRDRFAVVAQGIDSDVKRRGRREHGSVGISKDIGQSMNAMKAIDRRHLPFFSVIAGVGKCQEIESWRQLDKPRFGARCWSLHIIMNYAGEESQLYTSQGN